MAKTATINTRIEPGLKRDAEMIFRALGLTTAEAVTLFFASVRNYRDIPFEIRLPNATTRRAIANARNRKGTKSFDSIEELRKDLEH